MRDSTMTYGLHAGLEQWNSGSFTTAVGNRTRIGKPFTISYGGNSYDLNILWADGGMNLMNLWTVGYYKGHLGSNHAPPPGVRYELEHGTGTGSGGSTYGELSIYGTSTLSTWSYDDGSVKSLKTLLILSSNANWHVDPYQGNRRMYYPAD